MTLLAISIGILCQFFLVIGNLLLKHAMNATHHVPRRWLIIASNFAIGTGLLSLWFFLWLGLLRSWDLSQIFPFEGLSPVLLVIGAWIFLGERVSPRAWAGVVLIGVGVGLLAQP
ncbi:MAG: EamA family transporter [Proteobacteria bacterium]|nr:EamA family transporter [Pseudomonadota bacterium]